MSEEKQRVKRRPKHAPTGKADKARMEFSKRIFIVVTIWTMVVTVYSMIMMAVTLDVSGLEILVGSVAAEMATATGFYYSKAKAENRIKLRKQHGADVYMESGAGDV